MLALQVAAGAVPGSQTSTSDDPTKANRSSDPDADNRPAGTGNESVTYLASVGDDIGTLVRQSRTAGVNAVRSYRTSPLPALARAAQSDVGGTAQAPDHVEDEDILAELMMACSRRAPNRWQEFTRNLTSADWTQAVANARKVGVEDAAHALLTSAVKRLAFRLRHAQVIVVNVTPQGMAQLAPAPMPGVAPAPAPMPMLPGVTTPVAPEAVAPSLDSCAPGVPDCEFIAEMPLDALKPVSPIAAPASSEGPSGLPGGRVDVAPDTAFTDDIDPGIKKLIDQLMAAMSGAPDQPRAQSREPSSGGGGRENGGGSRNETGGGGFGGGSVNQKPQSGKEPSNDLKKEQERTPFGKGAVYSRRYVRTRAPFGQRTAADLNRDTVPRAVVKATQAFDPILMDAAGVRIPNGAYLQVDGVHGAELDAQFVPKGTILDITQMGGGAEYRVRLSPLDSQFEGRKGFLPGWPFVLVTPQEFAQYFKRVNLAVPSMSDEDAVPEMPGAAVKPGPLDPTRPGQPGAPNLPAQPRGLPTAPVRAAAQTLKR